MEAGVRELAYRCPVLDVLHDCRLCSSRMISFKPVFYNAHLTDDIKAWLSVNPSKHISHPDQAACQKKESDADVRSVWHHFTTSSASHGTTAQIKKAYRPYPEVGRHSRTLQQTDFKGDLDDEIIIKYSVINPHGDRTNVRFLDV